MMVQLCFKYEMQFSLQRTETDWRDLTFPLRSLTASFLSTALLQLFFVTCSLLFAAARLTASII